MSEIIDRLKRRFSIISKHQSGLSVSYIIYTLSLGFAGLLQIILLFILARSMSTQEFGVVAFLMVLIPITSRLVTLGSDIGLSIRIWKRTTTKQQMDLSSMFLLMLTNFIILTLLIIVLGKFLDIPFGTIFFLYILIIASLRTIVEVYQVLLRREDQVLKVGLIMILRAMIFFIVCLGFLFTRGADSSAYIYSMLVSESLMTLYAISNMYKKYHIRLIKPGHFLRMKKLVNVGFPSIPGTVAVLLLAAGDRIVITAILGLGATGIYTLGQKLSESIVQLIFSPFASAFGPYALKAASEDQLQAFNLIGNTAITFSYVGSVILGLPVIFAHEGILFFADERYSSSIIIFFIVSIACLIYQITQVLCIYFSHTENLVIYMWIIIVASIVNIILNFIFIHSFGIAGAALASLFVYECMLLGIILLIRAHGVNIVSIAKLHIPIIMFCCYLSLIFFIDSRNNIFTYSLFIKFGVWMFFLMLAIYLSSHFRKVVFGSIRKVNTFLQA